MTVNELANKLKCHVMRHGDCIVVIGGKEVDNIVWMDDPSYKREVVEIRPISKRQLIAKLNELLIKKKEARNDSMPETGPDTKNKKL